MKPNDAIDPDTLLLVCAPVSTPLMFRDNLVGVCKLCETIVQYRPHAPKGAQLVCPECWLKVRTPDDVNMVTETSLREVLLDSWMNKGRTQ